MKNFLIFCASYFCSPNKKTITNNICRDLFQYDTFYQKLDTFMVTEIKEIPSHSQGSWNWPKNSNPKNTQNHNTEEIEVNFHKLQLAEVIKKEYPHKPQNNPEKIITTMNIKQFPWMKKSNNENNSKNALQETHNEVHGQEETVTCKQMNRIREELKKYLKKIDGH